LCVCSPSLPLGVITWASFPPVFCHLPRVTEPAPQSTEPKIDENLFWTWRPRRLGGSLFESDANPSSAARRSSEGLAKAHRFLPVLLLSLGCNKLFAKDTPVPAAPAEA